jgi:hypothetical protein
MLTVPSFKFWKSEAHAFKRASQHPQSTSALAFPVRVVWFAPSRKILFNSVHENQMANEPFSRVLIDKEPVFSGQESPC